MASVYGNLGLAYQTRGDLAQGEAMHQKALALDERLVRVLRHSGQAGFVR